MYVYLLPFILIVQHTARTNGQRSIFNEKDFSFLKTKLLLMEKTMAEQESRISNLEIIVERQKNKINNLINANRDLCRKSPFIESGVQSLKSMSKRRKYAASAKLPVADQVQRLVRREVPVEDSLILLHRDTSHLPAFYAYLSSLMVNPGHHHTLVFDTVITNSGNNYNKYSGMFTVPVSGLYVFSASVAMDGKPTYSSFKIMKNAVIVGVFYVDAMYDEGYQYSSATIVIAADQGDVVFVRTEDAHGSVLSNENARSFFAGWKIQ